MSARPVCHIAALCGITLALASAPAGAAGLSRSATDARSLGMGGATNSTDASALAGVISNPAALGWLNKPAISLHISAGLVDGSFTDRDGNTASLSDSGLIPDAALAFPIAEDFAAGIGAYFDAGLRSAWVYRDVPGGADGATSYGVRTHRSEIGVARVTAALAWNPVPQFTLGAGVAAVWNRNTLKTPYIFQSQQTLRTVKTLLDLETEGWGVGAHAGIQWKPDADLTVGLAYRMESRVETHGRAKGDADEQLQRLGLGAARSDFHYDAEVTNVFPQSVVLGVEWKASDRLTLAASIEWINYQRTFDTLVVDLTNGTNADLNGLTGSDDIHDEIPLRWRDQWIVRLGAEYQLTQEWAVRAGYAWSQSPVPDETLTPLTALIPEHTVSAGLGWASGNWKADLGWEWQLPRSRSVGGSVLAAGEYAGSRVRVGIHWFGLTITREL